MNLLSFLIFLRTEYFISMFGLSAYFLDRCCSVAKKLVKVINEVKSTIILNFLPIQSISMLTEII